MKDQRLLFKQLRVAAGEQRGGNMPLLMRCLNKRQPLKSRQCIGKRHTRGKAGHIRALHRTGPGRNAHCGDLAEGHPAAHLLQQLRQRLRVVKDRIALPQPQLPGTHRQKTLDIILQAHGIGIQHGHGGSVIAGVQP